MDIMSFLDKHTIVSVGNIASDKCVVVEVITDSSEELIKNVISNNCYISEIRWWHRVEISTQSPIGYGGTRDPRDPQNYYFAETDICCVFQPETTISEYIDYLYLIKAEYSMYDIYPAFDIKYR